MHFCTELSENLLYDFFLYASNDPDAYTRKHFDLMLTVGVIQQGHQIQQESTKSITLLHFTKTGWDVTQHPISNVFISQWKLLHKMIGQHIIHLISTAYHLCNHKSHKLHSVCRFPSGLEDYYWKITCCNCTHAVPSLRSCPGWWFVLKQSCKMSTKQRCLENALAALSGSLKSL